MLLYLSHFLYYKTMVEKRALRERNEKTNKERKWLKEGKNKKERRMFNDFNITTSGKKKKELEF